jgi:hypothetical protein
VNDELVSGHRRGCPERLRSAVGRTFLAISLETVFRHTAYTIVVAAGNAELRKQQNCGNDRTAFTAKVAKIREGSRRTTGSAVIHVRDFCFCSLFFSSRTFADLRDLRGKCSSTNLSVTPKPKL